MMKPFILGVGMLTLMASGTAFAYHNDMPTTLPSGLSDTETAALEEARSIREAAHTAAEKVIADAGIRQDRMKEIHSIMNEARKTKQQAITSAIEAHDYTAFQTAAANSPLAETIDTAEKFTTLIEAHTLRAAGDHDAAAALMAELGIEGPFLMNGKGMGRNQGRHHTNE